MSVAHVQPDPSDRGPGSGITVRRAYTTGGLAVTAALAAPDNPAWLRPVICAAVYTAGALRICIRIR